MTNSLHREDFLTHEQKAFQVNVWDKNRRTPDVQDRSLSCGITKCLKLTPFYADHTFSRETLE